MPPPSRSPYADATALRLGLLGPAQTRGVRMRLMEIRRHDKRPTDFYLHLTITCREPLRAYQIVARADFGAQPPLRASLTILQAHRSAAGPIALIERHAPVEAAFTLELDPTSEWLTFWVGTNGTADVPTDLAGELRLRPPDDDRPPEDLETARLPSLRSVARQSLIGAFRRCASPPLVLLGGLMRCEDPEEKLQLLRQLVDLAASAALVEAGVRDIAFCEEIVRGFPAPDFSQLAPDDPAEAALAVLHPRAPTDLVRRCLAVAFERQLAAEPAGGDARWKELARAAAVVLFQRDRTLLEQGPAALGLADDPARRALFQSLVRAAGRSLRTPPRPPPEPLDRFLARIVDGDAAEAERVAVDLMTRYDMVAVTVPPSDPGRGARTPP
ncbi:MAG: hypothetical protein JXB32_16355 [Deltaproteobacteria bacterium]|nr:hypothetical protein [Deltaproteobacteria bacterium]